MATPKQKRNKAEDKNVGNIFKVNLAPCFFILKVNMIKLIINIVNVSLWINKM